MRSKSVFNGGDTAQFALMYVDLMAKSVDQIGDKRVRGKIDKDDALDARDTRRQERVSLESHTVHIIHRRAA